MFAGIVPSTTDGKPTRDSEEFQEIKDHIKESDYEKSASNILDKNISTYETTRLRIPTHRDRSFQTIVTSHSDAS
uniref:Uncharacterized protein n=1 Tax=Candidatus Kentrum sp. SD TaxID=2126332 RepID=A0A451BSZ8_9GAMM|nr:MAG: hypothetical protein BECKSD772D_GA0070982_13421 [Candidatus Kentron sp. SD]